MSRRGSKLEKELAKVLPVLLAVWFFSNCGRSCGHYSSRELVSEQAPEAVHSAPTPDATGSEAASYETPTPVETPVRDPVRERCDARLSAANRALDASLGAGTYQNSLKQLSIAKREAERASRECPPGGFGGGSRSEARRMLGYARAREEAIRKCQGSVRKSRAAFREALRAKSWNAGIRRLVEAEQQADYTSNCRIYAEDDSARLAGVDVWRAWDALEAKGVKRGYGCDLVNCDRLWREAMKVAQSR